VGVALQGGVDYSNGVFYAGGWGSNADFADYEVDLYLGVKPVVGNFTFDLGLISYQYGDEALNSTEVKAAVSYPFHKGTIGAAYYHNLDFDDTTYYEINASYPVSEKFSVSGAIGEQDLAGVKYTTGNIGVTYSINPTLMLDARFSDTNIPEVIEPSKARLAVSLKAVF
jgi:uncharacterized protein (TIGR02001 family)